MSDDINRVVCLKCANKQKQRLKNISVYFRVASWERSDVGETWANDGTFSFRAIIINPESEDISVPAYPYM